MKKIIILIIIVIILGVGFWWWQQKTKEIITVEECNYIGGKEYNSYPLCPEGMEYLGRITELKGSNWSSCK